MLVYFHGQGGTLAEYEGEEHDSNWKVLTTAALHREQTNTQRTCACATSRARALSIPKGC